MLRFRRRASISLILAPVVALAATVAPEHVHEADADHPHAAVHRHLQPHASGSDDHDHARLADDDAHVLWLDDAQINPSRYHLAAPPLVQTERFEAAPSIVDWIALRDFKTPPPHGPPRATLAPRAPPAFPA